MHGSNDVSPNSRKSIARDLGDRCFGRVIEQCDGLLASENLSSRSREWVLRHRGVARMRRRSTEDELDAGVGDVKDAWLLSPQPDADLWEALGEAFEHSGKRTCAGECFRSAAARNNARQADLIKRARRCTEKTSAPEDIALARVYFRALRGGSSIDQRVRQARDQNATELYRPRWAGKTTSFLHVLRGNGSFFPIIKGSGGGYLLMHGGKGCVIDPGHGFIRNFRHHNYGFGDIHSVVITHGHDDHVMDLPAISSILHKAEELGRSVDLFMDETSFKAFRGHYLLATPGLRLRRPILKPGQRRRIFDDGECSLYMDVYKAQHKVLIRRSVAIPRAGNADTTKEGSGIGMRFRLGFPDGKKQYLVMPSDTGWSDDVIRNQYARLRKCDVAVLHVSSIERREEWLRLNSSCPPKDPPRHMKLLGAIDFIKTVKPGCVLLGERGAELDDVWPDIAGAVAEAFRNKIKISATDIGTKAVFNGDTVVVTPP